MGVARHEDVLILLALGDEFVEKALHLVGYILELMASEEFEVNEHLVVARASAVYLLAHVAQLACEEHLHLRVDILYIIFDNKLSPLACLVDILQFGKQLGEFVFLKQTDGFEHGAMCHGAKYIIFGKIHIHLAVATHSESLNLLVYLKIFFPKFHSNS